MFYLQSRLAPLDSDILRNGFSNLGDVAVAVRLIAPRQWLEWSWGVGDMRGSSLRGIGLRAWGRRVAVRLPIAAVLSWNLQCALCFLISAERYAPAFELEGVVGAAMVRSLGLLFIMWNVPYAVALIHPWRHRTSLIEALIMQTIGLLGELWLLWRMPPGHEDLRSTVWRFVVFDGAGVPLLILALWLVRKTTRRVEGLPPSSTGRWLRRQFLRKG